MILGSLLVDEQGTVADGTLGPEGGPLGRETYVRGAPAGTDADESAAFAAPEGVEVRPRILGVEPPVVRRGGDAVRLSILGVGLPDVEPADVDLGEGVRVVRVDLRASSTVAVVVDVEVDPDAPLGRRPARLGSDEPVEGGELGVVGAVDHLRIEPLLGLARLGGAPLVDDRQADDSPENDRPLEKKTERFRAYEWSNGPDGEPYTEDDVRIGEAAGVRWSALAVDFTRGREWSRRLGASDQTFRIDEDNGERLVLPGLGTFYYVPNDPKQETIGSIGEDGTFTPGGDAPMLRLTRVRRVPSRRSERNNTGDNRGTVIVNAEVDDEDTEGGTLSARAVCVVAPPDYVPLVPLAGPRLGAQPWKGLEADERHAARGR